MKIAIVIGHNSRAPGAYSDALGESEFPFNLRVASMVESGSHELKTFERRYTSRGYTAEIFDVYGRVDDWGANLSVELHFNAANGTAHGTETLSSGSAGSLAAAGAFQKAMVETFHSRDRGVKIRRTGRGSLSLRAGQAPAILTEPFFGDNPSDCRFSDKVAEAYSKAIAAL